jgi:delta-1-pyrroline-5-carboxylate synthetase
VQETLLVHKDLNRTEGLDDLLVELEKEGVVIYGGPVAHDTLKLPKVDSFHHEYNSMACTLEFVDDVQSAIDHINRYGSAHTDCIITTDGKAAETFLQQVDSAAVFHNASTRFCDGARFGLGAEVCPLNLYHFITWTFSLTSYQKKIVIENICCYY